jgi:hypothetical protein
MVKQPLASLGPRATLSRALEDRMTIELHYWPTPNGKKISIALEEMGCLMP